MASGDKSIKLLALTRLGWEGQGDYIEYHVLCKAMKHCGVGYIALNV